MDPPDVPESLSELETALVRFGRFAHLPPVRRWIERRTVQQIEPSLYRGLYALVNIELDEPAVGDVARFLDIEPSTASRLVDRLVDAELVERAACERDRRRCVLRLTEIAHKVLAEERRVRFDLIGALTDGWSDDERRTLTWMLDRMYDRARNLEP